jgi:integrase
VLKELSEPIKPVALFALYLGWRSREITKLTWARIDLRERVVRLKVGTDKNKKGREAYFPDELFDVIQRQCIDTSALERHQQRVIPWVFHRNGESMKDFRTAWENASRRDGFPDKYFHDFRRTAYRNMKRLGIPEKVMMDIIGHKTRSMADRYGISNPSDRKEAAHKMSGIVPGIVERKQEPSGER